MKFLRKKIMQILDFSAKGILHIFQDKNSLIKWFLKLEQLCAYEASK